MSQWGCGFLPDVVVAETPHARRVKADAPASRNPPACELRADRASLSRYCVAEEGQANPP
jgi:hypothetical protein